MSLEGEAASLYWPALAQTLDPSWGFGGKRARRARQDPINILFDVMSSFLARDIGIAVRRAGLHSGFGVLHTTQERENALAYDLIEEFRAPVAEACVLALIARKSLTTALSSRDETGCFMTREAWPPLIRGYEGWIGRPIKHPASGETVLWRGLFELQAHAFAQSCEDGSPYIPYAMDY